MSRSIGLNEWDTQRRSFEGRAEHLLIAQQRLFRMAQALSRPDLSMAERILNSGIALDLPMWFSEDRGGVPGADRFRPESMQEIPCATLLAIFAVQNDQLAFEWLLESGANPNQVFADNRDAAWVAMQADRLEIHRRLLRLGAPPNLRLGDGSRVTRLMAAVSMSEPAYVEQLLAAKANAAAYDKDGRTALHINFAIDPYTPNDMLIAEMLLAAGANPNAEDLNGVPPHLLATAESARSVLEGHELRVNAEVAARIHRNKIEAELQANTPPAHDPAEPDIPQIKAAPKKFKPKPPRL